MWNINIHGICIASFLISATLYSNTRNPGLLIIGVCFSTVRSVYTEIQNVTVYPSSLIPTDFTIYNDNRTWLEANSRCQETGGSLMSRHSVTHLVYLKSAALKYGWPPSKPIWIGYLKFEDDIWLAQKRCTVITDWTIHESITGRRQCLLLNMTTTNSQKTDLYAASCETKTGYLCSYETGSIYDGNGYAFYENMTLMTESWSKTDNMSSFLDCAYQLFKGCFTCYAAEFLHPMNICMLYKMDTTVLPGSVSITQTSSYQTLILTRTYRVNISDEIITAGSSSESDLNYPCQTLGGEISAVSTQKTCYCKCSTSFVNRTTDEIQSEMVTRKKELSVDKNILSAHLRTKTCAADDRISAGTIGYVAGLVLGVVIFLLIIDDTTSVLRFIFKAVVNRYRPWKMER